MWIEKVRVAALVLVIVVITVMIGSIFVNKTPTDYRNKTSLPNLLYNYAYINLPNGFATEGVVDSWVSYSNNDMIEVTIEGNVYYTHGANIILVNYAE